MTATNIIMFPGNEATAPHQIELPPIPGVNLDNKSFSDAAEIIFRINPVAKEDHGSIEALKQWMIDRTISEHLRLGSWGTMGFSIEVWQEPTVPTFYLRASVNLHVILSFLNREFPHEASELRS